MPRISRRGFLQATGAGLGMGLALDQARRPPISSPALFQQPGARPAKPPGGVTVINPRDRVPVSLIIDDSTCLVNLAHFCIPQFHEVFPQEYPQPWQKLPRKSPTHSSASSASGAAHEESRGNTA